jgi:hypothetical protein
MQRVRDLTQAYSQTPWRVQLQVIGAFLLLVIAIWIVASIYLDVTARAATLGRQVKEMQVSAAGSLRVDSPTPEPDQPLSIEELQRINADLQSKLAFVTSDAVMSERAEAMGYVPVAPEDVVYIVVEGYTPPQTVVLAPPPGPVASSAPVIVLPERVPLWVAIKNQLAQALQILEGSLP